MNQSFLAIAFLLFALAGFLWLTSAPNVGPLNLTPAREVSLEEYQRGAAADCPPGET